MPVVLKATSSRNLHTVLCGVNYLQACMGDELTTSTLPSDMLEEVVSRLLSVVTTSKVISCVLCLLCCVLMRICIYDITLYYVALQPKMRAGAVKVLEKMLRGAGVYPVETRLLIENSDESTRSDQVM